MGVARRRADRRGDATKAGWTLAKGKVLFGRPVVVLDCLVKDLSFRGAQVILVNGEKLSGSVFLYVMNEQVLHRARVVRAEHSVFDLVFARSHAVLD